MTAPLSHYFTYTGHNSYLTGNQINSDCSVLPIIKALKRGVRVVELDMWPSDDATHGVHVYHGWYVNYILALNLLDCVTFDYPWDVKIVQELPFKPLCILFLQDWLTVKLNGVWFDILDVHCHWRFNLVNLYPIPIIMGCTLISFSQLSAVLKQSWWLKVIIWVISA